MFSFSNFRSPDALRIVIVGEAGLEPGTSTPEFRCMNKEPLATTFSNSDLGFICILKNFIVKKYKCV